jgi:type II secretory pathway component PulC
VAEALGPAAGRVGDGQDALPTRLPLALYATIVGERPGLGLALIGGRGPEAPAALRREGERVTPAAILRRVAADRVELLVEGKVEVLALEQPADGRSDAGRTTGPDVPGATADPEAAAREAARAALPRAGAYPVYLDREMVRGLMTDRVALSAALEPVAMTVDGYRLLRLDKVAPGSLYELLGLEQGDVIVMVNERPIHEGDNPLWDALDRENEVRVRVVRPGGLARHYTYRFE